MDSGSETVLLTASGELADAVLATAAALQVPVAVTADPAAVAADWVGPAAIFVGGDLAEAMAGFAPRRRPRVFLVGLDAAQLVGWSVPLGAQVIGLPAGDALLGLALAPRVGPRSPVIAVAGAHGGAGASTLAAGLAFAGARRGRTVALVDLDPHGGGLDLLVGAERLPGWRWPRLLAARGEVGDLRDFLPRIDGVTLVSVARPTGGERVAFPELAAVESVVGALVRHHDAVVVDTGRATASGGLRMASTTLLTLSASVRGVAAASSCVGSMVGASLVVRQSAERVASVAIADALGLPLAGTLPHDRALPRAATVGLPPGRSGRRRWGRAVGAVLDHAWGEAGRGD